MSVCVFVVCGRYIVHVICGALFGIRSMCHGMCTVCVVSVCARCMACSLYVCVYMRGLCVCIWRICMCMVCVSYGVSACVEMKAAPGKSRDPGP